MTVIMRILTDLFPSGDRHPGDYVKDAFRK
jgi:hypothetical protein